MKDVIDPDLSLEVYLLPEEFKRGQDDLTRDMIIGTLSTQLTFRSGKRSYGNNYVLHCTTENSQKVIKRASCASYLKEKKVLSVFFSNAEVARFGWLVTSPTVTEAPTEHNSYYVNNVLAFYEDEEADKDAALKNCEGQVIRSSASAPAPVAPPPSIANSDDPYDEDVFRSKVAMMAQEDRITFLKKIAFEEKIAIPGDIKAVDLTDRIVAHYKGVTAAR